MQCNDTRAGAVSLIGFRFEWLDAGKVIAQVVCDRICERSNPRAEALGGRQAVHRRGRRGPVRMVAREMLREVDDVLRTRATPLVDRLQRIADRRHRMAITKRRTHEQPLRH